VLGNKFRDLVEAPGREHQDLVEMENDRKRPEEAVADGLNSTPAQSGTSRDENNAGPRSRNVVKEEEGIGNRFELA
jgi:hypothetical protein